MEYLHLAGQQAVQRSANAEAITHLTTALELLKTRRIRLSAPNRNSRCNSPLVVPLMATKGFAAPEVESLQPGPRTLSAVGRDPSALPGAAWDCGIYLTRADTRRHVSWGTKFSFLPRGCKTPHFSWAPCTGDDPLFLGEFVPARDHLEQDIALYDPQQHRSHAFLYGGMTQG